jgi:hypothetical protein
MQWSIPRQGDGLGDVLSETDPVLGGVRRRTDVKLANCAANRRVFR